MMMIVMMFVMTITIMTMMTMMTMMTLMMAITMFMMAITTSRNYVPELRSGESRRLSLSGENLRFSL